MPFIEKLRRHTVEFERLIYERCKTSCRKKVAVKEKLSQATVKEILNRFARGIPERSSGRLTRVLGIDEISLKKRHKQFVLVISDISNRSILAVLPDRLKDTLENWFERINGGTAPGD